MAYFHPLKLGRNKTQDGSIGMWHGKQLMAHLTPVEAKQLADRLVDLAELIEDKEQP